MNEPTVDPLKLIDTLKKTDIHDHLCLIYSSLAEQLATAIPFIRFGLERNEQCVYIVDDNTAAVILEAMHNDGIDVNAKLASRALIVAKKQETYLKNGFFDPDQMIAYLKNVTDAAKASGFSALRVTGEMTWALGNDPGVEKLMEYEAKLNHFLPDNDALAICQYNRARFSPEVIINVIRTHPLVIYGGFVCKNFYYVPPEEFLKPNQTYLEVERLLDNLSSYEHNQLMLERSKQELEDAKRLLERDMMERKKVEKSLMESEKQLKFLSSQLLTSQETERKRIAQELHDSVGQTLSALKYSVEENISTLENLSDSNCAQSLKFLIPKIQNAVEEIDRIGKGLWPSILDDLGIIPTINWFCREFQSIYSTIQIEQKIDAAEDEIPQNAKPAIYRILQESLNNAAKHSGADRVSVSLKKTACVIELRIEDNGRGFDRVYNLSDKNGKMGLGLISMQERTEMLGGSLEIASKKGEGTALRVLLPS